MLLWWHHTRQIIHAPIRSQVHNHWYDSLICINAFEFVCEILHWAYHTVHNWHLLISFRILSIPFVSSLSHHEFGTFYLRRALPWWLISSGSVNGRECARFIWREFKQQNYPKVVKKTVTLGCDPVQDAVWLASKHYGNISAPVECQREGATKFDRHRYFFREIFYPIFTWSRHVIHPYSS